MGYRFPAEVQNDRIYVERMVMDRPVRMNTPVVNRVSDDRQAKPNFQEMLEQASNSSKRKNFKNLYKELTGKGGRIDKMI